MANRILPHEKQLVMKFGGTSVGNSEAFSRVVEIVKSVQAEKGRPHLRPEWPRLVVVVSAMLGVTDLLLEAAMQACKGEKIAVEQAAQKLREMHNQVVQDLLPEVSSQIVIKDELNHLISDFTSLGYAIAVLGEVTPRALDAVAGMGERLCVRLLAAILNYQGIAAQYVDATQLIVTDNEFQHAHPDLELTRSKTINMLEPLFIRQIVPVVTGFIAATPEGITTTLGRGGSDYSAAILGAVLEAQDVWIWTDVDGVMSADPRMVPDARTIPSLSFREIAELAYYGAKVVHPKTVRPLIEAEIGIRVCNTFNPEHPGTRLVGNARGKNTNGAIKAVTAIRAQSLITIEGRGMLGVPGVAARAFGAVAATGTSVPLITQSSSEQSICFAVPVSAVKKVTAALENVFASELERRDIDRVWSTGEIVIITVVGEGMQSTPGIAGRVFSKLGDNEVNVIAIAQGSSEVSISLVVDGKDAERALRAIHELIVGPREKG